MRHYNSGLISLTAFDFRTCFGLREGVSEEDAVSGAPAADQEHGERRQERGRVVHGGRRWTAGPGWNGMQKL